MTIRFFIIMLLLMTNLTACSYYRNYTRNQDCEQVLKDYRQMIRWNEAEKAAIAAADAPFREEFSKAAEVMRRKKVTMVDVRMLSQECLPEQKTAYATVEFEYFILPDSRLKTVTDRQKWIFREFDDKKPELGDGWKLVSPLPDFK